jgi:hypothetical protein
MVFVAVELNTALSRNASRQRRVAPEFAEVTWHEVMKNLRPLYNLFDKFYYIKNDDQPDPAVIEQANKFLRRP